MDKGEGRLSAALGGGILLGLTVLGMVEGILAAYTPPVEKDTLREAAAGLALLAWAVSLLPRRRWLAWIGVLAVWCWLLQRQWAWACYGALVMLRQVTQVLSGTFPIPVLRPAQGAEVWVEARAVLWWLGLVLAIWALLLGELTARRRCWWATMLLTLPPLLPALLSGVTPAPAAMVILPAVWITLLLQSAVRRTAAAGRQLWLVLPAALAAVAAVTVLMPAGRYVQPAWTAGARGVVLGLARDLWDTAAGEEPAGEEPAGEEVDLSAAGPLRYTGRIMLRVESDLSGHFLLRGGAFGVYTGESWENDGGADYPAGAENILFYPAGRTAGRSTAMTIIPVGEDSARAFCPYQPVESDGLRAERDLGILREGDGGLVYFTGTDLSACKEEPGPPAPWLEAYSAYVEAHYLEVPEALEDLLWEVLQPGLAGEVNPELLPGTPEEYAGILGSADVAAQCLAAWAEYDPDAPRTPAGEDFVASFLARRRGYCMHFASAGVLMLRLLGIPARYVTGYSVEVPETGIAEVPDSAAHAWVEVYLAGYGWYPVEMTPGYSGEEGQQILEPEDPAVVPETPENPVEPPSEMEAPPPETAPAGEPASRLPAVWTAALILLSLTAWRFGLAALRRRRLGQPDANRAVIAAYRSMERMSAWGGEMDPRLTELAGKARFSRHTLTEAERREALERLEETARDLEAAMPRGKRLAFRWLWGRR